MSAPIGEGRRATMDEDRFEPRLGRIRSRGSTGSRKYLHRVLAAVALAGGLRRGRARPVHGGRIGRGAAVGRLLGSRDRFGAFRQRRAIVKTRLVRLSGKGIAAALAHLRYIQRAGVERDGSPGRLYNAADELCDGKTFLEHCSGDRHQFRIIVSAEDGDQLEDLKPLVRRWMARMEEDLGTGLDWVACDHRDTGRPHTHVILRGKDEHGANLVIARDYIARGMRERFAELITLDLGPRTDFEIARRLRLEVDAERLTSIDRRLARASSGGIVTADERDPFNYALRAGRLRKLQDLGLAEELGGGTWQLAQRFEERLKLLGERGDIIRTMQRALRAHGLERLASDHVVGGPVTEGRPLVGRVLETGLNDELEDSRYVIVDGLDGRVHRMSIGVAEGLPQGSIVRLSAAPVSERQADHVVAELAQANGGRYSAELHRLHDPSASATFIEAHVRRLEALRRAGKVLRHQDGSWEIASDHLKRARAFEERAAGARPVRLELLSAFALDRLGEGEGATWLDHQLVSPDPVPLRDSGFGSEVKSALAVRRQWLVRKGLATEGPEGVVYDPGFIDTLKRREMLRIAGALADELGLSYLELDGGRRFAGRIERTVDLLSGRFALVSSDREFVLVPWRPSLDRWIGRSAELRIGPGGAGWTVRGRGPEIG